MVKKEIEIQNNAGLHTRPAATLVKMASAYKSDFHITKDGMRINGKSIIGVMTLAASEGSRLELEFEGEDEETMAEEIVNYFERGFDEI